MRFLAFFAKFIVNFVLPVSIVAAILTFISNREISTSTYQSLSEKAQSSNCHKAKSLLSDTIANNGAIYKFDLNKIEEEIDTCIKDNLKKELIIEPQTNLDTSAQNEPMGIFKIILVFFAIISLLALSFYMIFFGI